jgi:hypothetical protein
MPEGRRSGKTAALDLLDTIHRPDRLRLADWDLARSRETVDVSDIKPLAVA